MRKIYLDNCCYNRPFDDQDDDRIRLETEAKVYVQSLIKYGILSLVYSFVSVAEIDANPNVYNKRNILEFVFTNASHYIGADRREDVLKASKQIIQTGVKEADAAHVACAVLSGCDYFLTTDKRLLKYKSDQIQIMNPVVFVLKWEEQ